MQTLEALRSVVDETIDIFTTFDNRFSYTPMSVDGTSTIVFSTTNSRIELVVTGYINAQVGAQIWFTFRTQHAAQGVSSDEMVIYSGVFDKSKLREKLSIALADWYGRLIRTS